jgi:pimeloyl-ACP methyl ester carboxylesterase
LVEERGVRLHAVVSGAGKALILLHGWPGFWKDWERVVEPLSSSAMLVLQDLRGFGLSDKPDSVEEYAPSSCRTKGPLPSHRVDRV